MTWTPVDCHAHSTLSDGALDVPSLIDRVRARGVRPSVSDHISRDVGGAVDSIDRVRAYLDELERYDVARGGEFCWHDRLWREMHEGVAVRRPHRLGARHGLFLGDRHAVHVLSRLL